MRYVLPFCSLCLLAFGDFADDTASTDTTATAEIEASHISTRTFKLNHISAVEMAKKFNTMWNGEFGQVWKVSQMAVAFEESNTVLVTAPAPILDACEQAVRKLDVEAPQVYIEARFVELGNTASHKVGINWEMLNEMRGSATLGGGIQGYNIGDAVQSYTRTFTTKKEGTTSYQLAGGATAAGFGGENGNISYFNGTLNFSEMAITLQALDGTADAKTFSNPKIIVSSGKKATVDMTTKYPNIKISAKRTTGTSDSLDIAAEMVEIPGEDKFLFAKESFFSWGISLDVVPRIDTNGLINVSIVPTISSLDSWVETSTGDSSDSGTVSARYPVIRVQRLVTEFSLKSGTTAVIGGLSVTEENQVDTGIPLLRDIPWIGNRLFGSTTRQKEQKEIIVFVTVGLVNPHDMKQDAGLPKNAVLGRKYTQGQRQEPGDRKGTIDEGFESLDLRPLEEQAKDPLPPPQDEEGFKFSDFVPFTKDPNYSKSKGSK